jgi:hypothetical protein
MSSPLTTGLVEMLASGGGQGTIILNFNMYSIVITTYFKRFETWLKPLIMEIKRQRPDVEVILTVNGELNYFDEDYRKNLLDFIKDYSNIYPLFFPRFRGCACLFNLGIRFATNETILVLSDDITLADRFFDEYEETLKIFKTFEINASFSAFSVSKKEVMEINWFDERLLGIGWEDENFKDKYKKYYKIPKFPRANLSGCKNIVDPLAYIVHNQKLADYIQSDNHRLGGQLIDARFGRYSEFNRLLRYYSDVLVNQIRQYPYESFYLANKHRL